MLADLKSQHFWTINIACLALTYVFVFAICGYLGLPPISHVEILATALNMSCVWLTRLENNWCWPIGIAACVLLSYTFFGYDLPGQAWLQMAYFIPIQFYGWYLWMKKRYHRFNDDDFNAVNLVSPEVWVSKLSSNRRMLYLCAFIVGTLGIAGGLHIVYGGFLLQRLWDASIVVASIIAQQLLNRKRVESWWIWLIPVNVSSVALFITQGAYLYAAMYAVFMIHAGLAIWQWYRKA